MPDPTATGSMAGSNRLAGSFRDPAGFVFRGPDGTLLRQVNKDHAEVWDAVVTSGLIDELHRDGLLVAHEVVDTGLGTDDAHAVLRPTELDLLSWPHEWCPGQLRDAALLTLELQDRALVHGMVLRDASAFNVQFVRGRAVFIDTLSFAPWVEGEPWNAYGQFCEHFLAPLALQTLVDHRLRRLLTADVGGVPLDLAASMLPRSSKLRPSLLTHLHLHAKARATGEADPDAGPRKQATFSKNAMIGIVRGLRGAIDKLTWDGAGTVWSDYVEQADHYDQQAQDVKAEAVRSAVRDTGARLVWDLGANTGRYSQLAAELGAKTIAFDIDAGAVERGWQRIRREPVEGSGDLLPLVQDLANPSPGLGWGHTERASLAERGPADLVMALALIHHLAIGNNVPMGDVVANLASLGRHVLVEWVPKDDVKVRTLLATREDVFPTYTREHFDRAIASLGTVRSTVPIPGTGRELVLFEVSR